MPRCGEAIAASATRSASCSYLSPGWLTRSFACKSGSPCSRRRLHSAHSTAGPADAPQEHLRCSTPDGTRLLLDERAAGGVVTRVDVANISIVLPSILQPR